MRDLMIAWYAYLSIDIGGESGRFAVPLHEAGHQLLVADVDEWRPGAASAEAVDRGGHLRPDRHAAIAASRSA